MEQHRDAGSGKLGAVGFCYGGGIVNLLATRVPTLVAGVPFYGNAAPLDRVPQIKAQLRKGKTLADIANATPGKSAAGLVDAIVAVSGTGLEAVYEGGRPRGEGGKRALDPAKLRALGWEPRTDLVTGLRRTWDAG